MVGAAEQPIDFFISRAGADAAFADQIGRMLENAGHSVVLQQWDFANRNFMERMHAALKSGARVIALLSNDYLASDHCEAEWQNAIAHDPLNKQARLIVMRVAECAPSGLLTALAYWDLVPVRANEGLLRDVVLAAVEPGRHKGEATPGAPYWREARAVVHRDIKPTPSFTGREAELAAIDAALWSGGAAAVTQPAAVHGLGGIGKSVLAREYAHRNRDRYAGVWWLNAAKPDDDNDGALGFDGIETALVELGAVFIPGFEQTRDRPVAARKALDFIAHGGFEKPWLLVYDNVDDMRALREWAPLGNAQVLVTSRISGFPKTVSAIEIDKWPLPDAVRYLLDESGRDDLTEDDAQAIAENLGCLPLALSHAAAYLRGCVTVSATDYVDALVDHMREAPEDVDYPRAVFATFQEAIIEAEAKAPGARAVFSLASFYAPDAIPEELFQQPPHCYPPDLAELATDNRALKEAMGKLHNLSLIDFDPNRRVFSVHRLVQAATRDALGTDAPAWVCGALCAMANGFPVPELKAWPSCERLAAHALALMSQVSADSRELAYVLNSTGDYLQTRSGIGGVLPLYERSRKVLERLVHTDPDNAGWLRDLSVSHEKIGDVLMAQGERNKALAAYRASLDLRSALSVTDPSNAGWQRDLSVSYNKVGAVLSAQGNTVEALAAFQTSLSIRSGLAAAEPSNSDWKRNLAVSHTNVGDLLLAQGKACAALVDYRASQQLLEQLAATDPADLLLQHDLGICHERIGDVLMAQGNLAGAFKAYKAKQAAISPLAAAYPLNSMLQHDLSISHERIGDVLMAQNDRAGALKAYNADRAVISRLAATDPFNSRWSRGLSVSHNKVGDVLMAQGKSGEALAAYCASLNICSALSAADPSNADWQNALSLSHIKVGDVLVAQNKGDEALATYRESQEVFERLAAADPSNTRRQRYLSVSHNKIGDVLRAQGHLADALESYRAAMGTAERLAATDSGNAGWQRDLIISNVKLAETAQTAGSDSVAKQHYADALLIAERLAEQGRLVPADAWMVDDLRQKLAKLGE